MKRKIRFIDCGANVGQSTEWALEFFSNQDIKVDCFEPLPYNYNILKKKFSKDIRVETHNFAISNSSEPKKFYCQDWGARTGSSLVAGKSSTTINDYINVNCLDISDWIKKNILETEVAVLKIDIEGSEYDVLPHLFENKIHDFIKYWLVEFHPEVKTPNYNNSVRLDSKSKIANLCEWDLSYQDAEEMLQELK